MQRIIYILLLFVGLLFSCREETNYSIAGKLDNSADSVVFVAINGHTKVDTIPCDEGRFMIKGNTDSLSYLTILIPETGIWLDVWVDKKNKLTLSGDVKYPDLIEIKGNEVNDKLAEFKSANQSLFKEKIDLFYLQQESVADTLEGNSNEVNYTAKISNAEYQLQEKAEQFVRSNPSSLASIVLVRDYLVDPEDLNKTEECLSLIEAPVTSSPIYTQLSALLSRLKRTEVGAAAPDFEIKDIKGDTVSLSDFKDKYLLLTFAASWCDICRRDNKGLVDAYNKYKKKGLHLFTVSFDEHKEEWKTAAKEDKITWQQAIDTQGWGAEMLTTYNITSIPANFLIDKNGIIIARNLFGGNLEAILEEHLQ